MNKIRVLHVLGGLNYGGAETFILNVYSNCDRNCIQFDALVRDSENLQEKRWNELEGKLYKTAPFPKSIFKNFFQTRRFLKDNANNYDVIHIHANALIYVLPIILAKKYGWKKIILHSHNTKSKASSIIHAINRVLFLKKVDVCLACGDDAGKWMFGNRKFEVVNNGINVDRYIYDCSVAISKKEEFGFSEKDFIVGNVGRFSKQKNHTFLLDVFEEILKQKPSAKLLLVGEGELKEKIQETIERKRIRESVVILSNRNDVPELLQAMDVFVFPSLYEGLSIALVEAQASGLPCVVSNSIDEKSIMASNVIALSLEESRLRWADAILQFENYNNFNRNNTISTISNNGYDIKKTVLQLQKIYMS